MDSKKGKWVVEGYEITQEIPIGDKTVLFGVNEQRKMPYLCTFYTANSILESYGDAVIGDDYAEMMELFADRVKEQCEKVREEHAKVTVPREKITEEMCVPIWQCEDIAGKIMAVKTGVLRPEYRSAEHQLVYAVCGNGTRSKSLGTACFCINLYSGERERWERYNLQGEVKPECLPQWAKERAEEIREREAKKSPRTDIDREAR